MFFSSKGRPLVREASSAPSPEPSTGTATAATCEPPGKRQKRATEFLLSLPYLLPSQAGLSLQLEAGQVVKLCVSKDCGVNLTFKHWSKTNSVQEPLTAESAIDTICERNGFQEVVEQRKAEEKAAAAKKDSMKQQKVLLKDGDIKHLLL